MVGDILKIKTSIPPLGTNILSRSRIQKRMEEGLTVAEGFTRRLTLVSAPAGFGKTTLVREWLSEREGQTAWYSLDEGDNEPERYWLYLITALQTVKRGIGSGPLEILRSRTMFSDSSTGGQSLLTPLLNDLFTLETPIFLVLDDYHLINNPGIHKDMTFFIENLPPVLHLVVTTRSDPSWPLPKWRARGEMEEIRMEELKFSRKETGRLFKTCKELTLSEAQVNTLHNKTEGWVTGLQLASFSLSRSCSVDEFIESFAGSHRHVLHFLTEEVFARQPGPVQDFLLQTSILNRFCAPLCDAVTGRTDSVEILAGLERDNLFMIPLDQQGWWYRYHSLFNDLLLYHVKKAFPREVAQFHERAGEWFLDSGEPGEAVYHAFAGGRPEAAAGMIHQHFEEILQDKGSGYLNRCLESFSPEILRNYPRLAAHRAFYRLLRKGREEAGESLALAEELKYEDKDEQKEYAGIVAAVKAYYNVYTHNFPQALENAEKSLQLLSPEIHYWRMSVAIFSGDARLFSGNPREAYPYYLEAHHNSQKLNNHIFYLSSGFKMATSLYYLGKLEESEKLARQLLQTAREEGMTNVPRAGLLWVLLGELLREKGELEEAERCMERGLFISRPEKPSLGWNYLFRAALYFSKQKYHKAEKIIEKIEKLHGQIDLPNFIMLPAVTWKARILLEQGEAAGAAETLSRAGVSVNNQVQGGQERGYLALSRILLEEKENGMNSVRVLLSRIEQLAVLGEQKQLLLETLLVKARLEEKTGRLEDAESSLLSALQRGKESGYSQIFIDEGKKMASIYSRIIEGMEKGRSTQSQKEMLEYIRKVYKEIAPGRDVTGSKPRTEKEEKTEGSKYQGLVEELSARELEILNLISQGLSNQDISEKLFISVGTVKWYTSNIYGKLGVRGRAQAVAVAGKRKLIP